jgi:hypothetical protein
LAPAPGSQVPSMAFATGMQARLPLGPLARGFLTTPQASLHAADWPVAPRPASTPGSHPTPGAALPGTLASPPAGLTPAGSRELVARLRRGALLSMVLGARATGRTFRTNQAPCRSPLGDPPTSTSWPGRRLGASEGHQQQRVHTSRPHFRESPIISLCRLSDHIRRNGQSAAERRDVAVERRDPVPA